MSDAVAGEHAARVLDAVRFGPAAAGGCPGLIMRSWSRGVNEYALDPGRIAEAADVSSGELERRREDSALLLANARPEMSSLFRQLAHRDTVVVIADAGGTVLDTVSDGEFALAAARVGMRPGCDWSERGRGTNGLGTCLAERRLVMVRRAEHFFAGLTGLSCAGAPIFDDAGNLAGVLDVTSDLDLGRQHSRVLIGMSAQAIEHGMFDARHRSRCIVRVHSRRELLHTFHEGLIALGEDGRIVAANLCALFQLGFESRDELIGRELRELFDTTVTALMTRSGGSAGKPMSVRDACGRTYFAEASIPAARLLRSHAPVAAANDVAAAGSGRTWGDPAIEREFGRALRVYDRGVPVLLSGETGSGKEIFTKALHDSGARCRGPFVAVNCAAVPENLIESELFGYRGGAFTGASREGRRGRIAAADKGTLLLDEIGDMPLALQGRLLRVLEEQEVTPLGGDASVKVDIRVVCATHRDLREMVAAGTFRSDLYFRLAGFTVELPPLRQRPARAGLIRAVLADLDPELSLDPAALALLETFAWPGNLRQLRNVLQTAGALCEGGVIRSGDLPPEIRDGTGGERVAPPPCEPASPGGDGFTCLDRAERDALLRLLRLHRWNITRVAAELGASRNTVYRKVNHFGLVRE